jgi:hypothetical protein
MTDLDSFLAKTQARLVFFLVAVLVILVLAVVAILLLPLQVNPTVSNLLVQVVTGVLALAGTGCGFFFARTRPGGIPDQSQMITQTHTAPDGTKITTTSPAVTPAGAPIAPMAAPVLQPAAPILQPTTSFKPTDPLQPEKKL